jgi:protein-histidine pros-kinase
MMRLPGPTTPFHGILPRIGLRLRATIALECLTRRVFMSGLRTTSTLQVTPVVYRNGLLLTIITLAIIEGLTRTDVRVPTPGAILLLPVAYAAFTGGLRIGLASAVMTALYSLHRYATPNTFLQYSTDNAQTIITLAIVAGGMVLMLGSLKQQVEQLVHDKQLILDTAGEGICAVDAQGTITVMNRTGARMCGWQAHELIGQPYDRLLAHHGAEPRAHAGPAVPAAHTLEPSSDERRGVRTVRRKDGTTFPAEYTRAPIHEYNRQIGSVITFSDISERIQAQLALRQLNDELEARVQSRTVQLAAVNQALQQASLAKDRFLASMSHELRTPLNAVIGFTGTLLMRLPGPLTPEQEKQLRTIQRSAQHLLALINDILDLAKIESGTLDMKRELVELQAVVAEVTASLRPLADQKNLQLLVDYPAEAIVIPSNRRALSQILINLVNNAIKFTEQGSVRLTLRQPQSQNGQPVEIRVADTGIGIRPEDQARLFQLFSQIEDVRTREHEGTGLGLHLSQKLAALLGGQITVQSAADQGTIFTLRLPAGR